VLYKTSYFPSVDFRQLSYDNTLSYVSDDILVVRLYKLFTNSEKKQKWHNTCKTSYMNQYETQTNGEAIKDYKTHMNLTSIKQKSNHDS